ncbi:MAG TPA: patatin-like phospholipase family protein [Acetobacteraceae bacterium]|nr:patatin-like phospholipase family protein [Acetobacteraceae bacterium]
MFGFRREKRRAGPTPVPSSSVIRVEPRRSHGTAVALQGGGTHGAFSWGVLDRLVEGGLHIDAICGVSSGSLLAVAYAQGAVRGGRDGARKEMRTLWRRAGTSHSFTPVMEGLPGPWSWGWNLANNIAHHGAETMLRLFSPAQLNPLGFNPMRALVSSLLNPALLCHPEAPRVTISATDVETGAPRFFCNEEITVDSLLASCCLPFLFPPVEIGGRPYWDGAYSGNPPLAPLLRPYLPRELILIRAQPSHRPGTPTKPDEIFNRLHEIACQASLDAELAALPPDVPLIDYRADATLLSLPLSTKVSAEADMIAHLYAAGRALVEKHQADARAASA